ncbi:MAG TPA: MarR family transcriptional regulator [Vineibacter sp.]|nr:MarR family transcriptional regulator [Vineibacter sp.]
MSSVSRNRDNRLNEEQSGPSLELRAWLPYRCSVIANRVSACLERMYGERFGLSVPGWRVMAVLGRYAPLSAKEVAVATAMDQVQITRTLTHLASVGLISRRTDPADRRRIVLKLSRKGQSAYAEIVPLAQAIEDALLADLSANERAALARLSEKVMLRSEELLGEDVDWKTFVS